MHRNQCSKSVTTHTVASYWSWQLSNDSSWLSKSPRWLDVLLFPDRVGNNTCQGNRQSDENITIYFPIIIITTSQAEIWLIQYRRISFVWIYFKPRNIMTIVNIPINHFLDFIGRNSNNHFALCISK